jgi:gas vesicle protein
MAERDEFGAFLLGFIVGGLTGAVAALLLAPQSGEQTRGLIKDKAIELGDKVQVTVEETRTKAEQLASEARTRAEQVAAEARARADEATQTVKQKAEELQQRGQVVIEEQKSKLSRRKGSETPPAETEG